jgi:hypothetical protein
MRVVDYEEIIKTEKKQEALTGKWKMERRKWSLFFSFFTN